MIEEDILTKLPTHFDDKTVERIEAYIERRVFEMFSVLRLEFGRVPTKLMNQDEVRDVMRQLAVDVARQVDGYVSSERYRDAQQASVNMINGVLAGIKLGKRENP